MKTPQCSTSSTGKTCFPACWRPVEGWPAAPGPEGSGLVRGADTRNVIYETRAHVCVCVCRTPAPNVAAGEPTSPILWTDTALKCCPFSLRKRASALPRGTG